MSEHARPTGGDERVEAATRFRPGQRVCVGTRDGEYVSYAGGQFHTHRYRIVWPDGTRSTIVDTALDRDMQAVPDDRDPRVEAALRAALDDLGWDWEPEVGVPSPEAALHSTIVAALAAADAVAAQDPAPAAGNALDRARTFALAIARWQIDSPPNSAAVTLARRIVADLHIIAAAVAATPQNPASRAEPAAWLWRRAAGDDGVRHVPGVNDGPPSSTMRLGEEVTYPTREAADSRARTWGGTVHALVEQTPSSHYEPPTPGPAVRRAVEDAIGGTVHVASEAAAAVDAVLALRSPGGWVDEVRDAVGEDDEGSHDGPAVTEPPC